MKKFTVDKTERREVTRERDFNVEYSGEDTSTSRELHGINVLPDTAKYFDGLIYFEPKIGKSYPCLIVQWSTGDSFSHEYNRNMQVIGVFETEHEAKRIKKILDDAFKGPDYSVEVHIKDAPKPESIYMEWKGYFEKITNFSIHLLPMKGNKKK